LEKQIRQIRRSKCGADERRLREFDRGKQFILPPGRIIQTNPAGTSSDNRYPKGALVIRMDTHLPACVFFMAGVFFQYSMNKRWIFHSQYTDVSHPGSKLQVKLHMKRIFTIHYSCKLMNNEYF